MTPESSTPAAGSPSAAASSALHPSRVLGAYLEPLVRGRRVAILGDATIGLAERLLSRGARLVHAYDPDAARVAEMLARGLIARHPHPSYAVFDGDLGVRDGAFDTIIVPDLSLFPDPAELLRRARRLTAPNGAAIVASPNPDVARGLVGQSSSRAAAPGYYALYDLVSLQFRHVRMVGQAPFVGYTVADFAPDGEPDVSIDTSLLEGSEEPEWFIALSGDRPVRLDAFSVIELPFSELPPAAAAASPEALGEAEAHVTRLKAELNELRSLQSRDRDAAGARAETATATAARLAEVEAELAARSTRLREIESRAGDTHVRAERLTHQIRDLEEELRSQRDRATRLTKQLDDEKRARTKVELEIGMIRNKPEIAGARDRLDTLGTELAAARARVAELEAQPRVAAPDPALAARTAELVAALSDARRELARVSGELQRVSGERDAARKRVQETEGPLEQAQRSLREVGAQQAELLETVAGLGREKKALEERAGRLEKDRRALEDRAGRLEKDKRALEEQAGRFEKDKRALLEEQAGRFEKDRRALEEQRGALDARRLVLEARIVELEHRNIVLEQQNTELARQSTELARQNAELAQRDAGDAAAAELAALEAALQERGHVIASLQAELRESERVGKELVDELGLLFERSAGPEDAGATGAVPPATGAAPPAPGTVPPAPGAAPPATGAAPPATGAAPPATGAGPDGPNGLRQQLDALARSAAASEADLRAANWKIAQLERELDGARGATASPAIVHAELEQALVAARAQIAALRHGAQGQEGSAPPKAADPDGPSVPPEVIEQSVLLHQIAGAVETAL
jgi:SAM-dependent methyltransferase